MKEVAGKNYSLEVELKQCKEDIKVLQCRLSIIHSHKEMLEKNMHEFNSLENSLAQKLSVSTEALKTRDEELEKAKEKQRKSEFQEKLAKSKLAQVKANYTEDTQRMIKEKQSLLEEVKKTSEELRKAQSDAAALRIIINDANKGSRDQLVEAERANELLDTQLEKKLLQVYCYL
eukprot:TRINITY_DN6071_c0_g3_i1.p1 TRINITY_DN6071_c0_g3~~TRINITY_DN6071_c0_g3_i1.p1  ORF type:complete len:175 (+),score=35.43 TRINITY_DN6071_c0_g3_i1:358-882(+)